MIPCVECGAAQVYWYDVFALMLIRHCVAPRPHGDLTRRVNVTPQVDVNTDSSFTPVNFARVGYHDDAVHYPPVLASPVTHGAATRAATQTDVIEGHAITAIASYGPLTHFYHVPWTIKGSDEINLHAVLLHFKRHVTEWHVRPLHLVRPLSGVVATPAHVLRVRCDSVHLLAAAPSPPPRRLN